MLAYCTLFHDAQSDTPVRPIAGRVKKKACYRMRSFASRSPFSPLHRVSCDVVLIQQQVDTSPTIPFKTSRQSQLEHARHAHTYSFGRIWHERTGHLPPRKFRPEKAVAIAASVPTRETTNDGLQSLASNHLRLQSPRDPMRSRAYRAGIH
jgi:hypothetical protein